MQQVTESTIELTEKQHSTGSIPQSAEDRSEGGHSGPPHHQAESSGEHYHEQVLPAASYLSCSNPSNFN